MPITWPSLSDLARMLGTKLSTLSRLPAVRRQPMTRIGREVKVPPAAAITILVERGLSREAATAGVWRVVDRRLAQVPALRAPDQSPDLASGSRLVRSSVGSLREARLAPLYRPHAGAPRPAPDLSRYEQLDRELGDLIVPVERYVYGDNR